MARLSLRYRAEISWAGGDVTSEAALALGQELLFHRRFARPGRIVDIGAHTGDFSFGLVDLPDVSLVAIEPLPWALAVLGDRVARSDKPITVIGAALSDRAGVATLRVPVLAGGVPVRPWASLQKDFSALQADHPEIVGVEEVAVEVTTLDSLGLTEVTAIKLDAEGAEYEVLRGARTLLAHMRPILSIELEERHRAGCTYGVPAFLDALDYVCVFEIDGNLFPFSQFQRSTMQRGSPSPASHDYSRPYVSCFYFLPFEIASQAGLATPAIGTSP
jgi:FkbM family methyltransferase